MHDIRNTVLTLHADGPGNMRFIVEDLIDHSATGRPRAHFNKQSYAIFIGGLNNLCVVEGLYRLLNNRVCRTVTRDCIVLAPDTTVESNIIRRIGFKQMQIAIGLFNRLSNFTMYCSDTLDRMKMTT